MPRAIQRVITGDSTLVINPMQVTTVSSNKGDFSLDKAALYNSVLKQFKLLVKAAGLTTSPAEFGLYSMWRWGCR